MNNESLMQIDGDLTFETVSVKIKQFLSQISGSSTDNVYVDMSDVKAIDSSGLAFMLEGLRLSEKLGKVLVYTNVPTALKKLAIFCRVENVLSLS